MISSLNRNVPNNGSLYKCKCFKFLGFSVVSQLNWKEHVGIVANKINSYNFMIFKIRKYTHIQTTLNYGLNLKKVY